MELSVIYYTQFIISVVYALLFSSMIFDFTRGSRRANVAQILFFMCIHSFLSCFTIYETDISKLQRYAVFMALTDEITVALIYNFILMVTTEYKNIKEVFKDRKFYTILPVALPLIMSLIVLLMGFNHLVVEPAAIPFYSIHSYESLFLRLGFRIYHAIFIFANLIAILIYILKVSKKRRLNTTISIISAASVFHIVMLLLQTIPFKGNSFSAEEMFVPSLLRSIMGFLIICIFILIFVFDGQEVLALGLKRNLLDAFGIPVFLFNKNLEYCYANNAGLEFIKKYDLKAHTGTKINDFFAFSHFRFIALPRTKGNTEIHYSISLIDEVTYTIKRTPVFTRFNIICGYSVIVSEFENSFLVSSLEESSYTDSLTLCKTRRIFENAIQTMKLNTNQVNYAEVKLKNLSRINEELGHDAGDEYIKTTVSLLQISQNHSVFRLESSTFAFFLEAADIENLEQIKKRIENACKDFSAIRSIPLELDISLNLEAAVSGQRSSNPVSLS